jgi:hypothetical protein
LAQAVAIALPVFVLTLFESGKVNKSNIAKKASSSIHHHNE